ncbi:MAG: hypothetical protein U1E65_18530 [Myxococcota bacterium]
MRLRILARSPLPLWCSLMACSSGVEPLGSGRADAADAGVLGSDDTAVALDLGVRGEDAAPLPADAAEAVDAAADAGTAPAPTVYLIFAQQFLAGPRARIEAELRAASLDPVVLVGPQEVPDHGLVLAFGSTTAVSAQIFSAAELAGTRGESYRLRSRRLGAAEVIAVAGGERGAAYGAYAALEALGFAFLHPLAPHRPQGLGAAPALDLESTPRWRIRGLQLHTMHPLELADLLNGWGPLGPDDEAGWRAMLPEWETFLEWMVANGQNHVHWLPLLGESWRSFAESPTRYARFAELTARAHAFGIEVGVDVPLVLHQQHAWRMIENTGDLEAEKAQIRARLDALFAAGFDYVATENGTTEFTHGSDQRMVEWMSELARYASDTFGKHAYIKIHTSSGQSAENYLDPRTGQPINFNFLPHFADPRLGVMPHTVQHWALDDRAPTYGNGDFHEMRAYLDWELGQREVVWHPENAYWVSFDIDVPLFLPVYADRRLHDLRLIVADETAAGHLMDGQLSFSSGWEWGYWLQEVITARAAWDPLRGELDEARGLRRALDPIVKPFGTVGPEVAEALVEIMQTQKALILEGRQQGVAPADIVRRNGQAYLQGFETFDDIGDLAKDIPGLPKTVTQPDKLGLVEMRSLIHAPPRYAELRPLLAEMADRFRAQSDAFAALAPRIPAGARDLFDDLADGLEITALRAEQVLGLYDYVDRDDRPSLSRARAALDSAQQVVLRREANYRVPADRIAGWSNNPTSYEFRYLWTVRTLYYWWRDELKAVDAPRSPCLLNIINPADVAAGEGIWVDLTHLVRDLGAALPLLGSVAECLAETRSEPVFPPNGLRTRP